MSAEDAAELGAQNLWRLFGADLSGKGMSFSFKINVLMFVIMTSMNVRK
jgi:hypothetical protein